MNGTDGAHQLNGHETIREDGEETGKPVFTPIIAQMAEQQAQQPCSRCSTS